ncbi:MAG TPA: hypothetical protein VFO55_02890 [Gemmatimonadaceae bacterium]|nr:hypothetical protein [Gemmatimonadaceae bacterium]
MIRFRHLAATALLVSTAGAQGNVSTQGYGYPQGQLSSRALSMGGAIGEIDPGSALNPAALGRLVNRTVLFQIEPEYRTISSGSATDRTTTARYPMVNIGVPFGQRWVFGVSASSLLDRTWQTTSTRTRDVGGDMIETTTDESSNGAINDLRLAATWTNHDWLYVGAGLHAITGRNVLTSIEQFDDSAFNSFASNRVLAYGGSALSAGVQLVSSGMSTVFGLSYRMGNSLKMKANDTTLARGDVPSRFGASLAFTGIEGTVLAARVSRDQWSSMTSMLANAASGEKAHDSWEFGGGAEVSGPRLLGQTFLIRAGGRARTLPFEAAGKTVTERTASLGSGANFGGGRMSADLTVLRQWRNVDLPAVKERAWTLSLSLTARP